MGTTFRHTFGRLLNQVWTWGFSFAVLGWFIIAVHDMTLGPQMMEMLRGYPPELMAFFGDLNKIATPGGYLDLGLLSYGVVVLGVFALLAGSGLIAADEEAGRLDLVQAAPLSRSRLFFGRFLGLTAAMAAILGLTWAGCAIGLLSTQMAVSAGALALPFLSAFAVLMLFAALALWLSMALPSRTIAASAAGMLLVASYFLTSLGRVINSLKEAAKLSPLSYFQSGFAVDGLDLGWFGGLLGAAGVFTLLAWWGYQRRDLRISGEGSWQLGINRK
jgi:ABC-2 type transport system permease protein